MPATDATNFENLSRTALRLLAERCPRLAAKCYWAGTAAIASEELHHRRSFDLDFHTRDALCDVRPFLAEIQAAFPAAFEIVQAPDEFGSGFEGVLTLPGGERITVQVLSNYEDVSARDLVVSTTSPAIKRISLSRYLADKVQCVVERAEARDLVDILATIRSSPALEIEARRLVREQDAVLLVERLLAWTDEAIERDLEAYDDVPSRSAREARDLLLKWVKAAASEKKPE
jgi:hypothetical protein